MKKMPMKLKDVKTFVFQSGRSVFTKEQFSRLLSIAPSTAKNYMYLLVKEGYVKRLRRGVITFSTDDFINATQMIEPSYISAWSALFYHKIVLQAPAKVFCITTKNSYNFDDLGFHYYKITPELFYGYEKTIRENSYYNIATKEKAVLDMIYLNLLSPGTLREVRRHLNKNRIKEYLAGYEGKYAKKLNKVLLGA